MRRSSPTQMVNAEKTPRSTSVKCRIAGSGCFEIRQRHDGDTQEVRECAWVQLIIRRKNERSTQVVRDSFRRRLKSMAQERSPTIS